MRSRFRKPFVRLLIPILVLNSFVGLAPVCTVVQAQDRVIIVNADQPNVWTLEQAHYLLAQMHRRNLDLKATGLGDLNPNEINGLRFDVLRQLVELGVEFNQAERAANRMVSREQNFNSERRQTLLARRDELQAESLSLTRDITQLQSEKASATSQEDKDRLDAKIAAKTSMRAEVDKRIEFTNEELKGLPASSGTLKGTEAEVQFDPNKLPKSSAFDDAFKDAAKKQIDTFNNAPGLNATLRLENFLQMQYEIIAKQLSLLRDEVGPGERLLFLELPQTVNVSHHEANKKWAQSWWRIAGYTKPPGNPNPEENVSKRDDNKTPTPTSMKVEGIMSALRLKGVRKTNQVEYVDLNGTDAAWQMPSGIKIDNQLVRTVELIPRQSSLNVNDMKLRVKSGALTAVASFLFGFGARLNVQRQREQFSQFVQQELYSSAFGKGSREFGWTFTPMPGTDRLLSGVRTTYAVVVVPREATSIVLESNGCYFPRSAYQPNDFEDTMSKRWNDGDRTSRNCSGTKAFVVPVPAAEEGTNEFWVKDLSFRPVDKNDRIVVLISGYNFSSQTGVLVNGVPLTHSIGLAQPLIRDDSNAGEAALKDAEKEKVRGRIERVDAEKVVISFEIPDFEGTPTITMVTPGRAVNLNWIKLRYINGEADITLDDYSKKIQMFGKKTEEPTLAIAGVDVFRSTTGNLTAIVSGVGLDKVRRVFVNGADLGLPTGEENASANHLRVVFPIPSEDTIRVTLLTADRLLKSQPTANPAFLTIKNVSVVSYETAREDSPATLVVRIEGTGFTDNLLTSIGELAVKSATEAILKITDPQAAVAVTLTDRNTGQSVKTIVARKSQPQPK